MWLIIVILTGFRAIRHISYCPEASQYCLIIFGNSVSKCLLSVFQIAFDNIMLIFFLRFCEIAKTGGNKKDTCPCLWVMWSPDLLMKITWSPVMLRLLRLFSHDGKVRILNFNSKYAFWITQCTHERSNCDIWLTQCTHERPNLRFCIRERGEEAWLCLGIHCAVYVSCASVCIKHVQRAVL